VEEGDVRVRDVPFRWMATAAVAISTLSAPAAAQAARHINPVIDLLTKKQSIFGLYAPSNRRGGRGAPPLPADSVKSQATLAMDAVAHTKTDYIFDGSMEGNFDAGYATFSEFAKGMATAGGMKNGRITHPLYVKTPEIAADTLKAAEHIARQLNLGVSGIVFVGVESAREVQQGLAMMRFRSQGGIRPDDVGAAPAFWGMSEKEYKAKADVWPLNPKGELVNWTIVETKEGLANIREIAAVKGIGTLLPGAGSLRQVFSTTDANGQRVVDEKAWEAAIQSVLAACKEFSVPCGYPATATDIEMRMTQGFSVFVIGWGEPGFKAIDVGMKAARR